MAKPPGWTLWIAAIASGSLVATMFAPHDATFLVWISLLPLLFALWSVDGKTPARRAGKGFALGLSAGVAAFGIQLFWLTEVSPLGAIVLPLYLGGFWGLFGVFAAGIGNPRKSRAHPLALAFSTGAMWGGLEWLRGWLFTGFGWNGLGVAFHDTPLIAQSADLFGVAGLSALTVFLQAALLLAARFPLPKSRRLRDLLLTAAVLAAATGYGAWRIHSENRRPWIPLKTLLVQVNIPQDAARQLWHPIEVHLAYEDDTSRALDSLSPGEWPDWVLWPESALTGRILRTADGKWGAWEENAETIANVRQSGPFTLFYGVNELEAVLEGDLLVQKRGGGIYNSIAVMSPDDELQTFRKHHLVIFGETIPFVESIPLLKKIYAQQAGVEYQSSFTPGDSFEPLQALTAGGQSIGVIPTVCFEDTVGRLNRRFVRPGPQVIVNLTNDGWFNRSAAAAQHFQNARFRAIELRRPMLRCANTGVSAAIDSTGSTIDPESGKSRILTDENGSHFTRGSLLSELKVAVDPPFTLYARIGDAGIIALALLGLAISFKSRQLSVP